MLNTDALAALVLSKKMLRSSLGQLGGHVLLRQRLDGLPVEVELLGDILDRGLPAATPDVVGEALGVKRVVGEEVELFAFHSAATLALNPPDLEFQIHAPVAARQVANPTGASVVPAGMYPAAAAASRFFERRTRSMTTAFGSPKMPRIVGCGRKPGNAYASVRRRLRDGEVAIQTSCPFCEPLKTPQTRYPCELAARQRLKITHSIP